MPANEPRAGVSSETQPTRSSPFDQLIAHASLGSEEAFRELHRRHAHHVFTVVRHFLPRYDPLRRELDSTDIAQEAWRSVFEAVKQGKTFVDEARFRNFLFAVASNCSRKEIRHHAAEKRSRGQEEPLEQSAAAIPAKEPGPAELAASADEWNLFLASLAPIHRLVFFRHATGETLDEIADGFRLNVRFVQRVAERARQAWVDWQQRSSDVTEPRDCFKTRFSCRKPLPNKA